MNLLSSIGMSGRRTPPPLGGMEDYAGLIVEHLSYIEQQCRRAVSRSGRVDLWSGGEDGRGSAGQDNEADELLNEVLDRLRIDNFRALREFKGKSKITTYLTTIISNLIIDIVRKKKGRSRARERAQEMGEVAEKLYELVFGRGYSLHEAHSHLEISHGIREPLEKLQEMVDRMRGRERFQVPAAADVEAAWLVPGKEMLVDDALEVVVSDPRRNAEDSMITNQRNAAAQEVVDRLVGELSGEERLILRMRFPASDEDEPKSIKVIGVLLGVSEKVVDARIRRTLVRFREILLKRGLTLNDLIDA
jgi:RNA polymerase sigma factor (sigma-70 family)